MGDINPNFGIKSTANFIPSEERARITLQYMQYTLNLKNNRKQQPNIKAFSNGHNNGQTNGKN